MSDKVFLKDYSVIKNSKNFFLIHKGTSDPFDEKESQYYVVFKRIGTIEAKANSYLMACDFLNQAEEMFMTLAGKKEDKEPEKQKLDS